MLKKNKPLRPALRPAIIIMCFLICIGLTAGVTLSRYETTINKSIDFRFEEISRLEVKSESGWVTEDGQLTIDFEVTNSAENSDGIQFMMYLVSSPTSEAESTAVTLTNGKKEYTAVCEEIDPESSLYRAFGCGYVYRFYSDSEEKLQQTFDITNKDEENEGILTSEKMTLKISGKNGEKEIDSVGLIKLYAVFV